jgi:hypothetical protein
VALVFPSLWLLSNAAQRHPPHRPATANPVEVVPDTRPEGSSYSITGLTRDDAHDEAPALWRSASSTDSSDASSSSSGSTARISVSKDAEILVLRHQLAVLRRQVARPRFTWSDRALIATLAKLVPRERWAAFLVTPETILRWHRALVRRRWTYPNRRPGRPSLPAETVELIVRLAEEKPALGLPAHRGRAEETGRHGLQDERRHHPAPPPPSAGATALGAPHRPDFPSCAATAPLASDR